MWSTPLLEGQGHEATDGTWWGDACLAGGPWGVARGPCPRSCVHARQPRLGSRGGSPLACPHPRHPLGARLECHLALLGRCAWPWGLHARHQPGAGLADRLSPGRHEPVADQSDGGHAHRARVWCRPTARRESRRSSSRPKTARSWAGVRRSRGRRPLWPWAMPPRGRCRRSWPSRIRPRALSCISPIARRAWSRSTTSTAPRCGRARSCLSTFGPHEIHALDVTHMPILCAYACYQCANVMRLDLATRGRTGRPAPAARAGPRPLQE